VIDIFLMSYFFCSFIMTVAFIVFDMRFLDTSLKGFITGMLFMFFIGPIFYAYYIITEIVDLMKG